MVAEVPPDARQIRPHGDVERPEVIGRADTGAQEEGGAAVRPRRDDDMTGWANRRLQASDVCIAVGGVRQEMESGPIMPDVGSWTQPRQQAISLADE